MASCHKEKTRTGGEVYVIRFTLAGCRKKIQLGTVPKKLAETICSRVEELVNCQLADVSCSQETARWLGQIDDKLHEKLSKPGLVTARQAVRLGDQLERYIKNHSGGKEPGTLIKWKSDKKRIVQFFGADKDIKKITRSDCEQYKTWLYQECHLADSTVGRAIRGARMFFTAWVRDGILSRNPFDGVKGSNAIDESRNHYIPAETVKLAIEYCPDAEWRAIFALARFGGLRPGEIFVLKLDAIKWERDIIIVTSPKTKRHVGGGQREIPIFPELRPYLLDVAESAREGAVYVLDRLRERTTGKAKTPNLGKIVTDILERAGIPKWTKPFVSMRGSCETDLAEVYPIQAVTAWIGNSPKPIQAVTAWIGNSPKVAQKHYLRVLPSHFEQAVKNGALFDKKHQGKQAFHTGNHDTKPTNSDGAKYGAASVGNGLPAIVTTNKKAVNCSVLQFTANVCKNQIDQVGLQQRGITHCVI